MKNKILNAVLVLVISFVLLGSGEEEKILLFDDFSSLKSQMISGDVVGAFSEYHNIAATQPKGNWIVSCFKSEGSQRAWRLIIEDSKHIMYQSYTSTKDELKYTHPILIAGDSFWQDYKFEVEFSPENNNEESGVLFRYQNDRCYYFFGVKGERAILKKVQHEDSFHSSKEIILAEAKTNWQSGQILTATIILNGCNIKAQLNNGNILEVSDLTFLNGKIGLVSDIPTRYFSVKVTADDETYKNYIARKTAYDNEIDKLRNENPKPILWKKIALGDFGAPRSMRFGDLDGDGKIDILIGQVKNHGPKDRNSELGCLTAINLDGKVLWQIGKPDIWNDKVTSDVAFQIYDIDNDGKNEVIYCKDM